MERMSMPAMSIKIGGNLGGGAIRIFAMWEAPHIGEMQQSKIQYPCLELMPPTDSRKEWKSSLSMSRRCLFIARHHRLRAWLITRTQCGLPCAFLASAESL